MAANSAPVAWQPVRDLKDDPGVATNGVVIKAYTFGSGKTPTVNGIVFRDFGTQTLDRQTLGSRYNGFWNVAGPAKELLDGAIQDTSSLEKPKAQRVTLHGLTPGRKYQIQLWVADRRTWPGLKPAFASSAQTVQASPQDSNIPTLRWQGGDKGPTAQSVMGTFTADKAGLTLTFTPTGCYSRFQSVPPILSHNGFRSGSPIPARLTVSSSMAIAFLKHSWASSNSRNQ